MKPGAPHDPRFERRFDASRTEPVGQYPIPPGSRLKAVECVHCSLTLGISTWNYLNGFLVVCPHCGGYHGKRWGIERTVVAGLILSCLSFFFVFRPRVATGLFVVFALVCGSLGYLAVRNDTNEALMIAALGTFGFGPPLINAVTLVRHQMWLDRAPPEGYSDVTF